MRIAAVSGASGYHFLFKGFFTTAGMSVLWPLRDLFSRFMHLVGLQTIPSGLAFSYYPSHVRPAVQADRPLLLAHHADARLRTTRGSPRIVRARRAREHLAMGPRRARRCQRGVWCFPVALSLARLRGDMDGYDASLARAGGRAGTLTHQRAIYTSRRHSRTDLP